MLIMQLRQENSIAKSIMEYRDSLKESDIWEGTLEREGGKEK